MNEPVSCPECDSYAVTQIDTIDENDTCEYHCDDCGEYFTDRSM